MEDDPRWRAERREFTHSGRMWLLAGRYGMAAAFAGLYGLLNIGGITTGDFTVLCVAAVPALIVILALGWLAGGTWRD